MKNTLSEVIYTDAESYYNGLLRDIRQAKSSIFLETFIFANDETGQQFAHALAEAAERGVIVRVLVDGAGSFITWGGEIKDILEKSGAETRVFHPFPWHFEGKNQDRGLTPFIMKYMHLSLIFNARNHRKTCIIDNRIAHVGSLNISHCHTGSPPGLGWRDTAVRLEKINIETLIDACEQAWAQRRFYAPLSRFVKKNCGQKTKEALPRDYNPIIRLNHTWKLRRKLFKGLLRNLSRSKKRLWIISAYFVPDNMIIKRLIKAAERGVDVRILVPQVSDVLPMGWISASFFPMLLKHNIKIYEYQASMMHAKTIIIDDWFIVGSSNLNHRSIFHDLEIDIQLQSEEAKKTIVEQFEKDLQQSHQIFPHDFSKKPVLTRLLGSFLCTFKHWL